MPLGVCEASVDEPIIMREAGNVRGQQCGFQSSETVFTEAESIDGPGQSESIFQDSLADPGLDADSEPDKESEALCDVPNQEFNL